MYQPLNLPEPTPTGGDWCVYLVRCNNGALYCGISNNPSKRFASHLSGKGAKFMRTTRPLEMRLVYAQLFRSEATKLEPKIKKLTAFQKRQLWQSLNPHPELITPEAV